MFSGKALPPPDSDDELALVSDSDAEEAEIVPFDRNSEVGTVVSLGAGGSSY
jgi:hypothetical protein